MIYLQIKYWSLSKSCGNIFNLKSKRVADATKISGFEYIMDEN